MNANTEITRAARVFLVDDDRDMLTVLTERFKSLKMEVVSTSTSTTALEDFKNNTISGGSFDLVALDIRMPRVNGNVVATQIRQAGYKGLIVALTAATSGSGRKVSKDSGFDYYFSKTSINKELILALLNECRRSNDSSIKALADLLDL